MPEACSAPEVALHYETPRPQSCKRFFFNVAKKEKPYLFVHAPNKQKFHDHEALLLQQTNKNMTKCCRPR